MSDAVPRRIARVAHFSLRVQSVYRSLVNIATPDGLLTVAAADVGALPNGIVVDLGSDWRALGIRAGMTAVADQDRLDVFDARLGIRLDAARRWSPRLRLPDEVAKPASGRWRRRRQATRAIAATWASSDGLGPLLRCDGSCRDQFGVPAIARPIVARLISALERGDRNAAGMVAIELIGLGPGLTPSGDDALVGMEAVFHALGSPMAGFTAAALHDVEDRTTAVAATMLRHAAAGETAERIHILVDALAGPDELAAATATERAVAWGATSGTDCLFGVLVGLDIATAVRGPGH